jgi:hypothetical protein
MQDLSAENIFEDGKSDGEGRESGCYVWVMQGG